MIKLGYHKRAFIYNGLANYKKVIQAEVWGDFFEKLPNTEEERGEVLIMGEIVR